ncbi:MAG: serine/threonine protein phosphatase [Rhodobacteraceae bacterium]|nr:serine/threonine protein phosphatase [Paracoccaceae bacterium]
MRGFTTVRDLCGNTHGMRRAINDGVIPGPRIVSAGACIGGWSSHADFMMDTSVKGQTNMERIGMVRIADGPDEVRLAIREEMRKGASFIKIMIGGGGDRDALVAEWDSFDARAALVGAPYIYVGGNHDLSSEEERAIWKERYGHSYYHFRFKDVLFLVLDTEDMSAERRATLSAQRAEAVEIYKTEGPEAFSQTPYALSQERVTGAISATQGEYFVEVNSQNRDARHTFVITHKPAWEAETTEFHRIETALSDMPYTVFNGHEHFYEYRQRFGRDYIQLATTSGQQFPEKGLSQDHIMLITVRGNEVEMVNLMLAGILDRKAMYPGNTTAPCFDVTKC